MKHSVPLTVVTCVMLGCGGDSSPTTPRAPVFQTYTLISNDVPKTTPPIPRGNAFSTTASTLDVARIEGVITDVKVTVHVTGTWICNLSLNLAHPDGTGVLLLGVDYLPPGFGCGNELLTTFPTLMPTPLARDLTTFRGKPANGRWTLTVGDDGGWQEPSRFVLHSWLLELTVQR